jgi:Ferritin-like
MSPRRKKSKSKAKKVAQTSGVRPPDADAQPREPNDPMRRMNQPGQISPRNLTARLAFHVAGNPDIVRPEDAVANCYPGLELDIRNLDRRFFPGLVFDFVARNDIGADYSYPMIYGAKLAYVDPDQDPDLKIDSDAARTLAARLAGKDGQKLAQGNWYLDWIVQGGKRLRMDRRGARKEVLPLDGLYVWRLVRCLEPGPLKIGLKRRDAADTMQLDGWRRVYADPETGVINGAYQPGELLQSLCSPWQHDFRDCYCHYWASNHPDVVFGEIYPGEQRLPGGGSEDAERANVLLDWLRSDRSRALAGGVLNSFPKNRPFQYDHFQINQTWQDLNIVIADTEIGGFYIPESLDAAEPFDSPGDLANELRETLSRLELALVFEYLYARFSLLSPEEAARKTEWPTLVEDVTFARYSLLLVAMSEMQHLRWANELLWELYKRGLIQNYEPVLIPAECIPTGTGGTRPRELRRLNESALKDFINVERPSGSIDGAYARVVATLRDTRTYGGRMIQLALRIANDGTQHFERFLDIRRAFETYKAAVPRYPYLRDIQEGTLDQTCAAFDKLGEIINRLNTAYVSAARGDLPHTGERVAAARVAMNDLLEIGEDLASRGIGVPFFAFWPAALPSVGAPP